MIVNVVLGACLSVMEEDIQNLLISKQMIIEQHQAVNAAAAVHILWRRKTSIKQVPDTSFRHRSRHFWRQFPTILSYVK